MKKSICFSLKLIFTLFLVSSVQLFSKPCFPPLKSWCFSRHLEKRTKEIKADARLSMNLGNGQSQFTAAAAALALAAAAASALAAAAASVYSFQSFRRFLEAKCGLFT